MTPIAGRRDFLPAFLAGLAVLALNQAATAQQPKSYTDFRKDVIEFPLGATSFVDRVHSVREGTKKPLETEADPKAALGEPDYKTAGDGHAFSLGCKGEVAFEFIDNAIVDVPGPDLFIFEVGKDVEPTEIALSNDGETWEGIGRIDGGRTSIDLADYGMSGRDFRFVLLKDTGKFCDGRWPGADIDAVGAIGSATRFRLESQVLFDFDKDALKPDSGAALEELLAALGKIRYSGLVVVGHTDAKGSDSYNQGLSERRAKAVANYLAGHGIAGLSVAGRGEREPIDLNDTESGRAANRRVEIIALPL